VLIEETVVVQLSVDVEGPHHLWHLDGNLKLSHFHLVIHAAIDGFSRLATFIHCSDNNRASTVLLHFQLAVDRIHLPITCSH
jgi:hypothetical protein